MRPRGQSHTPTRFNKTRVRSRRSVSSIAALAGGSGSRLQVTPSHSPSRSLGIAALASGSGARVTVSSPALKPAAAAGDDSELTADTHRHIKPKRARQRRG